MKRITYLLLLFLFAHIPTFAQVDNDSIEEDDIIQHADSALLNMLVPDSIVRLGPKVCSISCNNSCKVTCYKPRR